jgi:hypothetical protein
MPRTLHVPESLLQNDLRMKLIRIIRKARSHLKNERSPRHPKSILAKACDLHRNIPRWEAKAAQFSSLADLPKGEVDSCAVLKEAASEAIEALQTLVVGITDHDLAVEYLRLLRETVDKALLLLGCEFRHSDAAVPMETA